MKEKLIEFKTAKLAKQKGFPKNRDYCDLAYRKDDKQLYGDVGTYTDYPAPTQSLLQKWLRDEHIIQVSSYLVFVGSDEWDYAYGIHYLPKEKEDVKRRCPEFKKIHSFIEYGGCYTGAWSTYEEALEEGLIQALNLIR